jgi:hypothetical protein
MLRERKWQQLMLAAMKIEGPRNIAAAGGARKTGSAAAPGFAPAAEAPQRSQAPAPVSGVAALEAILALQADEPPAQRRLRQAKRGRDALDALERLEGGLLLGHAPAGLRAELESLRHGAQMTGDAGLDDVLREIDTRLAVELAKLDQMAGRA